MVETTDQALRESLGSRLRAAREEAGMTQEAVSAAMGDGFSAVSLYRWENGREAPSVPKVVRLAELYGVSIDWLAGRTPYRQVFSPGKVVVDQAALDQVRSLAAIGGRLDELPPELIRHPGIDYAWTLPSTASLLDGEAAGQIERNMREMLHVLSRVRSRR